MVSLVGDARTVGTRWGTLNAADTRRHTDAMVATWRKRGLSDKQMVAKSEPFRRFDAKFAPHWLDEAAAIAQAAGTRPEFYTAFLAGKYRDLFFVDECTSFLAVGDATADGATLFHKNRDNVAREQSAYYKRIAHASNPAGFHTTGDTSDTGLMMMVNDHGLAGSADVGGLPEDRPKGDGVMNPYILRVIAEQAERCEDALEIIQQCIREGWYAGGRKAGTNWLFADRHGTGMRVAQNSHAEKHWVFHDTTAFLARGATPGARLITGKKGQITLRDMNAAATHPSICFETSISALTVRIDPKQPADLSSMWFALPACSPYVPVFPAGKAAPRPLVDGTCFEGGRKLLKHRKANAKNGFGSGVVLVDDIANRRAATQDALYAEAEKVERAVRAARAQGNADKAAKLAAEGSATACTRLMQFLAETEKV